MTKEEFYREVADLFGVPHEYREFDEAARTRWSNRSAGNGRYEKHGIVRMFSHNAIHVALWNPRMNGFYSSPETALKAIREALS